MAVDDIVLGSNEANGASDGELPGRLSDDRMSNETREWGTELPMEWADDNQLGGESSSVKLVYVIGSVEQQRLSGWWSADMQNQWRSTTRKKTQG